MDICFRNMILVMICFCNDYLGIFVFVYGGEELVEEILWEIIWLFYMMLVLVKNKWGILVYKIKCMLYIYCVCNSVLCILLCKWVGNFILLYLCFFYIIF